MGTILTFKRTTARPARAMPPASGEAVVIIFPGVRYERRDEPEAVRDEDLPARRSRRSRGKGNRV